MNRPAVSSLPAAPPRLASVVLAGALLLVASGPLSAQEEAPSPAADRPAADAADVASPGAIVAAAYDVISGPTAEARDWDRFRSLFLPEARLIPASRGPDGNPDYRVYTVEEFIGYAREVFSDQGFHEEEIFAEKERFGDIAHVFSTYVTRRTAGGEPVQRGINSFQLWYDGDRWWIVDIFWHAEREGAPIPGHYGG